MNPLTPVPGPRLLSTSCVFVSARGGSGVVGGPPNTAPAGAADAMSVASEQASTMLTHLPRRFVYAMVRRRCTAGNRAVTRSRGGRHHPGGGSARRARWAAGLPHGRAEALAHGV